VTNLIGLKRVLVAQGEQVVYRKMKCRPPGLTTKNGKIVQLHSCICFRFGQSATSILVQIDCSGDNRIELYCSISLHQKAPQKVVPLIQSKNKAV
jgi:hypothetical protein